MANEQYNVLRTIDGFNGYQDIPEVVEDSNNIRQGVLSLGARETDIIQVKDADYSRLRQIMKELVQDVGKYSGLGMKTLIFFYYAGHGGMKDNHTVCISNGKDMYPIEK